MRYPKMILFDYGHTLLYDPDWNPARGDAELMKHVVRNPNNCTLQDVRRAGELQKAGLCADEVWYCGDNPQGDIEGAAQAGIYPVWYDNGTERGYKDRSGERMPQCEHLHIHEWTEMVNLLEGMET